MASGRREVKAREAVKCGCEQWRLGLEEGRSSSIPRGRDESEKSRTRYVRLLTLIDNGSKSPQAGPDALFALALFECHHLLSGSRESYPSVLPRLLCSGCTL